MPRRNAQKPTEAEMEILAVLWRRGAATVREIHEIISAEKPSAYTTTLKLLQIMTGKGLVEREEAGRAHVYRAKLKRETTQRKFTEDLLNRVFGGSAAQLVMRVLESKPADAEELAEIRQMIDKAERSAKKRK